MAGIAQPKAYAKNFNEADFDSILEYVEIGGEGLAPGSFMPFLYEKQRFCAYKVRGNHGEALHIWKVE